MPTKMHIVIKRLNATGPYQYEADVPERPGSPPVGRGRNWKESLGDFFLNNAMSHLGIEDFHVLVLDKNDRPHRFPAREKRS